MKLIKSIAAMILMSGAVLNCSNGSPTQNSAVKSDVYAQVVTDWNIVAKALPCVDSVEQDQTVSIPRPVVPGTPGAEPDRPTTRPVVANWIVTVKPTFNVDACAATIAKSAKIFNVMSTIGVIAIGTYEEAASVLIERLPCVLAVEKEGSVSGTGVAGVSNQ